MTPAQQYPCPRCGFRQDPPHPIHLRNCVPFSQWPEDARARKAAAIRGTAIEAYEPPPGVPARNRLVRDDELDPVFAAEVTARRDARAEAALARHRTVESGRREPLPAVLLRPVFSSEVRFGPVTQRTTRPDDLGDGIFERARQRKAAYDARQPENQPKESSTDRPWWADLREAEDPAPDAGELADFVGVSTEERLRTEAEAEHTAREESGEAAAQAALRTCECGWQTAKPTLALADSAYRTHRQMAKQHRQPPPPGEVA